MDQLSEELFGQSRNVTFRNDRKRTDLETVLKVHQPQIESILGQVLKPDDIYDLTGLPNGSLITNCQWSVQPDQISFNLEASHAKLDITRQQQLVLVSGAPTIEVNELIMQRQRTGLGSRIFAHQAYRAAGLGFEQIQLFAARGQTMFGYAVWPVFGFDGSIRDLLEPLSREYRSQSGLTLSHDIQTLQALLALEYGLETWIQAGDGLNLTFDLDSTGESFEFLETFMSNRNIQLAEKW
jgi:hypothetical protein